MGSTLTAPITTPGCQMIQSNTLTGKPFIQLDTRFGKVFNLGERAKLNLYAEFFNLFNRANFCNSYEQNLSTGPGVFNTPQSFCGGPSNGGVSGFSSAAVPSMHSQFGLRFEF